MKIGVLAISSLSGAGISDLINQTTVLADLDQHNDYYIFLSSHQKNLMEQLPASFTKINVVGLPANPLLRTLVVQFILPFHVRKHKIKLLYCLGGISLFFTFVKTIALVQNANIFSREKTWSFYQRIRNQILKYLTILSVRKADLILYPSENSRELFNKYLGVKTEKTRVLYHGCYAGAVTPCPDFNLSTKSILSIASIMPYKRIEVLMQAFDQIVSTLGYQGDLLIVGEICEHSYFKKLNELKAKLKHGARIKFAGKIDYKYINWLYTQADLFVFTSIEETFGIPLLEAMKMGLPVVAADTKLASTKQEYFNPTREICQDAVLYYNPFCYNDLAEKISQLLKDKTLCSEIREKALKRAEVFSGEVITKELINIFDGMK